MKQIAAIALLALRNAFRSRLLLVLFGLGAWVHELLDQPIGGLALIGIGLCCVLAAAFPVVATYLTRKEQGKTPFDEADD